MQGRFTIFRVSRQTVLLVLATAVAMAVVPHAAMAHRMSVFAVVDGKTIRGEAYFRGGTPVQNAIVSVFGADGKELGQTKTDQQGHFIFSPKGDFNHKFVVDAGDGHAAEYILPAAELADAPPDRKTSSSDPAVSEKPAAAAATNPATTNHEPARAASEEISLQSVHRQVIELRKQIDQYEQKTRFHDLLGGIGYILGLMGLGAYFLRGRPAQTRIETKTRAN